MNSRSVIYWLLAVAFLLRVFAATYWQSTVPEGSSAFRFGDSDTYWVHAQRIASGEPYRYLSDEARIFRAPLYPIVLSPFAYFASGHELSDISGTALAVRILGAGLGTLCVWLVWSITTRLAGMRAGLVAAFLAAIYPGSIGMSIFVLSEMVFCPLMLASLACSSLAISRSVASSGGSKRSVLHWVFLSGLLTGLACLARPSWGLWAGVLWIYILFVYLGNLGVHSLRDIVRYGLVYVVGIVLAMSPWWIRNFEITGKFVPSTLQVGASLYDGWHPGATGSSDEGMAFVEQFLIEQLEEDRLRDARGETKESTLEWRLDRRIRNAAISWVRENPSDAIRLGMVKFWKTWRPLPVAVEVVGQSIRVAEGVAYLVILLLGALGLWATRHSLGAWLFAVPMFYFGILHMAFIGSVRYRQPAILVLCVLAGCGANWILDCWRQRRRNNSKNEMRSS
ncbi:ArnT family glycosyltransferase [Pirellulaceae bacterium SH449]